MRIILNHLTKMNTGGRICVAGIDPDAGIHVRPTTPREVPLTRALLRENRGPFAVGSLVDLGTTSPAGSRPEVEDHRFTPARARHVEVLSDAGYLTALDRVVVRSFAAAFGNDVVEVRPAKFAVPQGGGIGSLGVMRLASRPRVTISPWNKPQVELTSPDVRAKLTLTDYRFFEPDHVTVKRDVVDDVNRRTRGGAGTYLMIGLARALPDEDGRSWHWIQANGICLDDRPVGEVP